MDGGRRNMRYRSRRPSVRDRVAPLAQFVGEASWQFWLLAGFLCLAFALGGGSRSDVEGLIALRPLSALALGVGCLTLQARQVAQYRWLFALAVACVVLVGMQLVPLPVRMLPGSPGRALVSAIDSASGLAGMARPLSLSPPHTWNALWATMAPMAVLVLGAQLGSADLRRLLPIILLLGLASAAFSIAQTFSDVHSVFYLYQSPHVGTPIGLFANRNHNAVVLATLLPMLVVWAQQRPLQSEMARRPERSRRSRSPKARAGNDERKSVNRNSSSSRLVISGAIGLALLPVILGTGSRSGLAIAVLACLCLPMLRGRTASDDRGRTGANAAAVSGMGVQAIIARSRKFVPWVAPLAGLFIVGSALWLGRAESVNRLLSQDATQDLRFQILPTVRAITAQSWPLGSGAGTFFPTFRAFEPDSILSPHSMAQATNDWIEVAMTSGLPGIVLLAFAVVLWLGRARVLIIGKPRSSHFARLGLLIILFLGLASITDYPLRVPSISCLIVVAALWCLMHPEQSAAIESPDYRAPDDPAGNKA